jgi:predicted transposase/invertase (TIGR01784 family)
MLKDKDSLKIFPPTWDFAFKNIFGDDEQVLLDFVNSVFEDKKERKVKKVIFQNSELVKDSASDKASRLDVKALLDDETYVNIEIQIANKDGFEKRALYYWSKLYEDQIGEGDDYLLLKKSICINILCFNLIKNDRFHNMYVVKNREDNEPFLSDFEVHFLELPKWADKSYDEMTKLEKWALFLKAPDVKVLEDLSMQEPIFGRAYQKLKYVSQDKAARERYEAEMKYQLDFNTAIHAQKQEIARNLKSLGTSIEVIVTATGLPKNEIEKL